MLVSTSQELPWRVGDNAGANKTKAWKWCNLKPEMNAAPKGRDHGTIRPRATPSKQPENCCREPRTITTPFPPKRALGSVHFLSASRVPPKRHYAT